ncbi:hypothetical protein halTADL_1167 [Halohasta litchfieldiae]|jgi:hypothetical protein|uniref:Uncharacterized protein n=1 Tax=Halohasta litchfieldiae TaxID=1073996 RepID=A0A1H6S0Q2_9EURY|nr:hypothetical protein [Halohasta litchfieldiae]ATW87960.1 hypothetical protein halTADL_1167 [Halohasta litchfieldiae]SEI61489.1 hypothetical protein SAMN05444271_10427 [Halohasta litchfieldiae]
MTSEGETRAVSVVVDASPEGVQKYTARVACDDGEIESVDPGALERFFEIVEGGEGSRFVRTRAVDMTGEARHIEEPTPLFSVRFTEPVDLTAISLHFETILDHDSEDVPTESLRFNAIE